MLRARETFHAGNRCVAAGSEVHDHDEIVVGREHLFEPVESVELTKRRRPKGDE